MEHGAALFFTDYSSGQWDSVRVGRARVRSAVGTTAFAHPTFATVTISRKASISPRRTTTVMDPFVIARELRRARERSGRHRAVWGVGKILDPQVTGKLVRLAGIEPATSA